MLKIDFYPIINSLKKTVIQHSPEILTAIGVTGMISACIMVGTATPTALARIQARQAEQNNQDKLPIVEVVKAVLPCYAPAAITIGLSAACIIGGSSVSLRRNAALATAYTLSESALKEYQGKVLETIGEKKEKGIRDAIAKDRLDAAPVSNSSVIITNNGDTLCFDSVSGQYFKSSIEKLRSAVNELNRQMLSEDYVSLNDLYFMIGVRSTKIGDSLGWNVDHGLVDLRFSSHLADNGVPCLVVDYEVSPKYDYQRRL